MSLDEAVKLQKETPKTIMIDMYTDWCGWCKKMDAETFHNPAIANYINENFYAVRFNAETTDTIEYLGKTYINLNTGKRSSHQLAQFLLSGRMSYPTIVYIDFEFNVNPVPGYMTVSQIEPLLVYFAERLNKNCDYVDFSQDFKNTFAPDSTSQVSGSINWMKFDDAIKAMNEKPKKLIMFMNSDFNNSSKIMLTSTFKHPYIADFINKNFYAVRINYDTQDTLSLLGKTFINEKNTAGYPNQLAIALLQPDIKLPATVFFAEDFSIIFALRGYHPPKTLERYLEFIRQDLFKGGDWEKFNQEFKSNLNK
jgi:thioredoxin-related protein